MNTKEISPKFLENIPKGEDLFEGKSQEKIACILTDILQNDNFQIVGIDGGWGTGKSNLVKIVENKLTKHNFFVYDVWGHQEDDQRKSILVELTEFISNKDKNVISKKKKWEDKLKKLLSKEKEVTTINIPYLSVGFIFSLLSIIYLPSINFFKDSLSNFLGIQSFIWKFILVFFPLLIVTFIYSWNLVKYWRQKRGFTHSFKLASQETFQVYTNKQKEETKIETISENEPSVKDFRDWMKEIDSDLGTTKLILVFDNFDRLPKKNILSIWSSIHIFFSEDKYDNIKVIIPFDRLHINNAFKELNAGDSNYANDYINKTFDLVYRVSPPILSDWKMFLKRCWDEAIGDVSEDEYIRVEQIYEVFRTTITPREIIAFVNEVVSIKLLEKNIPDRYIALFVLNKETILEDPLKAITDSSFLLGLSYKYKDDDNFQKYITALAYQISPENALEVVYRRQLKDCLVNKNEPNFIEVSKTSVFNQIISAVLDEIEDFHNPILVLNKITNEANITPAKVQSIWDDIYHKTRKQENSQFEFNEPQKILFVKIGSINKRQYLVDILESLINHKDFDAVVYSNIIDELKELIKNNSIELDLFKMLTRKEVTTDKFIPLIEAKQEAYKEYQITFNNSVLDKYLSELKMEDIEDASFVTYLSNDYQFKDYEKSLKDKIEANKSDVKNLSKLFKALKYTTDEKINLLTQDEIYTLFTQVKADDDFYYDLVAMCLSFGSDFNSSYQSTFDSAINLDDEIINENVKQKLKFYIRYENFILNSAKYADELPSMYSSIVKKILEHETGDFKPGDENLILQFEKICKNNNLDPQLFIKYLNSFKTYEFINESFIKNVSNFCFIELSKSQTELNEACKKSLLTYFNSIDKDGWLSILKTPKEKDIELFEIVKFKDWNSYALEALKDHLISIVKSEKINNADFITRIILRFEDSNKDLANAFTNVRDEFILNRNINPELFLYFEKWLFKYASLESEPGKVIRTLFKVDLLDDENCVISFIKNNTVVKSIIKQSSDSESNDFIEGVKARNENEQIKRLAELLDIKLN